MWVKPVNPGILESYSFIIQPCRWKVPLCRWKVHLKPGLPGGTQKSRDVFFPRKHPKAWCINLRRSPKLCKMVIDGQLTLSTSASWHFETPQLIGITPNKLAEKGRTVIGSPIAVAPFQGSGWKGHKLLWDKNISTKKHGCTWLCWILTSILIALGNGHEYQGFDPHQAAPLTPPKSPSSLAQSPDPWNLLAEMWI